MVEMIHYRWDFIGLSTDTKPMPADSPKVVDGSTYYCSDNSKLYVFCKDRWYEKQGTGGGGGGTSDYSALTNKPQINGVELTGNKTTADLKIPSVTVDTALSSTSENPVQNKVINTALNGKQATLTSGTNIKTVNSASLLGSGNINTNQNINSVLATGATATDKTLTMSVAVPSGEEAPDTIILKSADNVHKNSMRADGFAILSEDTITNPSDHQDVRERKFSIHTLGSDIYLESIDMVFGEHDNFTGFIGANHMNFSGYRDTDPNNPQELNSFVMDWGETASVTMSDGLKQQWKTVLEVPAVDTAMSSTSTNTVQNKVINTALGNKANTSAVLTKTNTTAFTPTADYHPATKKYVDDQNADSGWLTLVEGVQYRKKGSFVALSISKTGLTLSTTATTLGTLPEGYRPTANLNFMAFGANGNLVVTISTTGAIQTRTFSGSDTQCNSYITYLI